MAGAKLCDVRRLADAAGVRACYSRMQFAWLMNDKRAKRVSCPCRTRRLVDASNVQACYSQVATRFADEFKVSKGQLVHPHQDGGLEYLVQAGHK